MDDSTFSEEEIREQLEILGYRNVSDSRLKEFKRDLEKLVQQERSKNSSGSSAAATGANDTTISTDSCGQRHGRQRQPLNDKANVYVPYTHSLSDHYRFGKENLTRPAADLPSAPGRPDAPSFSTYRVRSAPPLVEPGSADDRSDAVNTSVDSTGSERRVIKRKTVRKRDGQPVYEESLLDSEFDDTRSMEDAMERLRIPDRAAPHDTYRRPRSAPPEATRYVSFRPPYRLPEDYEGPTALIRPMAPPHTRNLKKTDPVSRYAQYRQKWTSQRAPGEKAHNTLRWSVREHMLYHDEVVEKRQHKVGAANSFVIPSDKKRKNLRWQIRNDLAHGVVQPSAFE